MSIRRHPLATTPDAWVDLRDVEDVPERLRRPVELLRARCLQQASLAKAVKKADLEGIDAVKGLSEQEADAIAAQMTPEVLELLSQLNDHVAVARIIGWSFEEKYGKPSQEALLELPGSAYDEIQKLVTDTPLEQVDTGPSQDPASPTVPSTGCEPS